MRVSIDFRVARTEIVSIDGTQVEGMTLNKALSTGVTYVVAIKCLDEIGMPIQGYTPTAGEMNFI